MTFTRRTAALAAALVLAPLALLGQTRHGDVHVTGAWSRALPPVAHNGAAYVTIENTGEMADWLLGGTSPIAERVELHTHVMEEDVIRMQRLDGLDVPPGDRVEFAPGGLHLMLMDLTEPLVAGGTFVVTLHFDRAGEVQFQVQVRDDPPGGTGSGGHTPQMGGAAGHGHGG